MAKYKVVFVRHGESEFNKLNRFTGWQDVRLTELGINQAQQAGRILKQHGYTFDIAFTSKLKRAIWTYHTIADELDIHWAPHIKDWRLNEKHYGALQGLDKDQTTKHHSEENVELWRSSFDIGPPALSFNDYRHPMHETKYQDMPRDALPKNESMKDCVDRIVPFWYNTIAR